MATAPIDTTAAPEGGAADVIVDYEAEAKKMGWAPADEFKGDPKLHIDAETFYNRAVEYMPIAKATIKKLSERIDRMERDAKQFGEFHSKTAEREYQRALDTIRAEQEAAVESGDIEAHRAASAKLDKLEKPAAPSQGGAISPEEAAEALIDWRRENKWFGDNKLMTDYAELQADKMLKAGMMPGPEHLAALTEKVKAKFPEEFEDKGDDGADPPRRRSAVDGGNTIPPRRGGKGFSDLPPAAQAACDRYIKQGFVKSREAYVKDYQW